MAKNPYEVLGVSPQASMDEIKQAYRELVKTYHPDQYRDHPLHQMAEEKMREINQAYDAVTSGQTYRREEPQASAENPFEEFMQGLRREQQARQNAQTSNAQNRAVYGNRSCCGGSCCEDLTCLCCADSCCECMGGDLVPCC